MKCLSLLRKSHNMSQAELAEKLGVTQQTISKYENGSRNPDTETLKLLSSIFDVSIDYLLGNTTKEEPNIEINIPKEYTNADKKIPDNDLKKEADMLAEKFLDLLIDTGEIKTKEDLTTDKAFKIFHKIFGKLEEDAKK